MSYFRELPDLLYPSFLSDKNSSFDYVEVKNYFRRIKLRDDLQNVFTLFDKYQLPHGSRPDTVAEEYYGSAELDWVVLMTAGIINVRDEWPLEDNQLYDYSLEKYGTDLNATKFYETKEIKDSKGRLIMPKGKHVDSNFSVSYYDGGNVTVSGGGGAAAASEIEWTLTANGSSDYTFTGDGFPTPANDPTLSLVRGQTYKFVNNTGAHPFRVQSTVAQAGGGTPYNDGVTNNDAGNGTTLTFIVPMDAPDTLYYQCTSHQSMFGTINIVDGAATSAQTTTAGSNVTVSGTNARIGVSNYIYEVRKNDDKRSIYLLKQGYLQQFLNDMRNIMTYDKSSEYINDKMIMAVNVDLLMP